VLVPVGCFDMGTTSEQLPLTLEPTLESLVFDEQPSNVQCFDAPFWLDQTEVTQADFERLNGQKASPNAFDGDQRPVERITWFEAREFCALRGMRLPTEREWEYAARGPDNRVYPWGNEWNPDNAVHLGNSNTQTANVGSRTAGASWVGALDMSGNVWEWVSSLYQAYPYVQDDGREDDTGGSRDVRRVLRGGSWGGVSTVLRAPSRFSFGPVTWSDFFGFRCARSS